MIRSDEINNIGRLLKPHGIKGEIVMGLDLYDVDLSNIPYVVLNIDGIYVPFFITSFRPKSADTFLVEFDGIENESDAKEICGHEVYVTKCIIEQIQPFDGDNADAGFYVSDLIGYTVVNDTDGITIGVVTDFDDSTENILLLLSNSEKQNDVIYVPLNPSLIIDIDNESKVLSMDIPDGLLSLN